MGWSEHLPQPEPLGWRAPVAGAISGVLMALALPPFDLWGCAWLFPLPLLLVVALGTPVECLAAAYVAGFLPISQGAYGLLSYDLRIWLLLTILGPAWVVLPAALIRWSAGRSCRFLVAAPLLWAASDMFFLEVLRLPFDLGISQARGLLPLQIASVAGSAGLTVLIMLTGALGARAYVVAQRADARAARRWLGLAALVPLSTLGAGWVLLEDGGSEACLTRVESAQPAIAFERARDGWAYPDVRQGIRADFERYLASARGGAGDLVVWPEGGGAFTSFRLGGSLDALALYARATRRNLLVSAVDFDESGRKFNAVFSIDPAGLARYDKRTPVPFAEDDVVAGERVGVVSTARGAAGLLVCYDSCFPEPARQATAHGADFLVVSTSGTAFGVSALPDLHLSMSMLRAVENRRSVLHAANGGPSAIIDPFGRITARTRLLERTTLSGCLWQGPATSVFTRCGETIRAVTSLVAIALVAWATVRRIRRRAPATAMRGRGGYAVVAAALVTCVSLSSVVIAAGNWMLAREVVTPVVWGEDPNRVRWQVSELPPAVDADGWPAWGAETLAFVASYYGASAPPADVLRGLRASGDRPDRDGMARAALRLGFEVQAMQGGLHELGGEPLPVLVEFGALAHAVLLELSREHAVVFEPVAGVQTLPADAFARAWDGRWLRIRPPRSPVQGPAIHG